MATVLIVDDERNIRGTVAQTFMLDGFATLEAEDGALALQMLEKGAVDVVVCDLQMPNVDGLGVLRGLRERGDETPLIFLTAHGSIETAVTAVREGAFDFVEKPPQAERLLLAARNAMRQAALVDENRALRSEAAPRFDMIGEAPAMRQLFEQVERVAPTQANVLVVGENGTGKELVARALHRHSTRSDAPFVAVNCAAIPRDLFESTLFGHERGAFTGATTRAKGKMVRADGGTLFLDEIGEIPVELQPKLLRALESGEVEPLGSERELKVDTRVIAATNRDLPGAVEDGTFRQDLYYRLQVVTLEVPALRERREDVPALVGRFLEQAAQENHLPVRRLTAAALQRLQAQRFPGNVRELRNLAERLTILTRDEAVDVDDLLPFLDGATPARSGTAPLELQGSLRETLTGLERRLVLDALERNSDNMSATARELGLERAHLYKKLKALEIER